MPLTCSSWTPLPLLEHRKRLGKVVRGAGGTLIEVEALEADGAAFLEAARKLGLEGIVSKKASSTHRSGRQAAWVKIKCKLSDTFAGIGFAGEAGSRPPRGRALYVGRRDGDRIVYAGKIQVGLPLDEACQARAAKRGHEGGRNAAGSTKATLESQFVTHKFLTRDMKVRAHRIPLLCISPYG
jgi:ATP-dependent DNA ligase